jgi:hypothetical protein
MRVKDPLFSVSRRLQHPRPEGAPPCCAILRPDRILFNYLLEIDFNTGHHDEPRFQRIIKNLAHAFTRVSNLLYRTCTVDNIIETVHKIRYTSPARQKSKTCNNILKYVRPKNNIYKKASFSIAQNIVWGGGSCGRRRWVNFFMTLGKLFKSGRCCYSCNSQL